MTDLLGAFGVTQLPIELGPGSPNLFKTSTEMYEQLAASTSFPSTAGASADVREEPSTKHLKRNEDQETQEQSQNQSQHPLQKSQEQSPQKSREQSPQKSHEQQLQKSQQQEQPHQPHEQHSNQKSHEHEDSQPDGSRTSKEKVKCHFKLDTIVPQQYKLVQGLSYEANESTSNHRAELHTAKLVGSSVKTYYTFSLPYGFGNPNAESCLKIRCIEHYKKLWKNNGNPSRRNSTTKKNVTLTTTDISSNNTSTAPSTNTKTTDRANNSAVNSKNESNKGDAQKELFDIPLNFKLMITSHDINLTSSNANCLDTAIGFSSGDILVHDPIEKLIVKQYNKDGVTDRGKVSVVRWLPKSHTILAFSIADTSKLYFYDRTKQEEAVIPIEITNNTTTTSTTSTTNTSEKSPKPSNIQKQPSLTNSFFQTFTGSPSSERNSQNQNSKNNSSANFPKTFSVHKHTTNSNKNPIKLWNIGAGRVIRDFAFSPNGNFVSIACTDGYLRFYSVEDDKPLAAAKSYYGGFTCVRWSQDGNYLVTGSEDDLVTMWQWNTDTLRPSIVARGEAHQSWVSSVCFDHVHCTGDNYRFASVGDDGILCVWEFEPKNRKFQIDNTIKNKRDSITGLTPQQVLSSSSSSNNNSNNSNTNSNNSNTNSNNSNTNSNNSSNNSNNSGSASSSTSSICSTDPLENGFSFIEPNTNLTSTTMTNLATTNSTTMTNATISSTTPATKSSLTTVTPTSSNTSATETTNASSTKKSPKSTMTSPTSNSSTTNTTSATKSSPATHTPQTVHKTRKQQPRNQQRQQSPQSPQSPRQSANKQNSSNNTNTNSNNNTNNTNNTNNSNSNINDAILIVTALSRQEVSLMSPLTVHKAHTLPCTSVCVLHTGDIVTASWGGHMKFWQFISDNL